MRHVSHRLFPFFVLCIVITPLLLLQKGELVWFMNSNRTGFLDHFFINASHLGNALTVAFLFLFVLRFKLKWALTFLLAFAIQILVVLLFKKGIYHDALRPYLYFKRMNMLDMLHLVEGVKIRYVNTFPSGHTATIFYLVSFFALLARNKTASWVLMFVGLFVGLSRVYLVQHFFIDVYFGMLFGIKSSIAAYLLVRKYRTKWHSKYIKVNIPLIQQHLQKKLKQLIKPYF